MKSYVLASILFCLTLTLINCQTNCFSIKRYIPSFVSRTLSMIRNHPKTSISAALAGTCALGYAAFHFLRERKIRAEKNRELEVSRFGVAHSDGYVCSKNCNSRTWGKNWFLRSQLIDNNGRAAWRFNDERGTFAELIDERHGYEAIRQLANQV